MSETHALSKIEDVEVLRAVAISMTLVGHSAELLYWGGPAVVWSAVSLWGGVDLFFCISGFVIARSLIENAPKAPDLTSFFRFAIPFWIRRVFRIWPAAFFWLAASLAFAALFNAYGSFGNFGANLRDALAAFLQVANLHYLDCLRFKNGVCNTLIGIYWSLSLEEQFYIILPFFLFMFPPRFWAKLLAAGILLQIFLWRPPWHTMWALRTDTLMFGVLIALGHRRGVLEPLRPVFLASRVRSWIVFVLGVALIAVIPHDMSVVTGLAADRPFIWFNTGLLALVCAAMVLIASFDRGYTVPHGFLRRVMIYIGSRSYALYLTHNCMFFCTRELFKRLYGDIAFGPTFTPQFVVVAFALSLLAAEATYRMVETPLRQLGRQKAAKYAAHWANPAASALARG